MFTSTMFPSELGWLGAVWNGMLLTELTFGHDSPQAAQQAVRTPAEPRPSEVLAPGLRAFTERLERWARGNCDDDFLDVALDTDRLTPFQLAVTERCRRIRPGETLSYGELAAEVGRPRAARAVGNVMRNNRWPLIVPCHRVLAAGGHLGGYSAPTGLAMKQRLLELERAIA